MVREARESCTVPVAAIRVGPRRRPVDETVVREIAQSIERHGLFQPIGVKLAPDKDETPDGVCDLVFGAHRLAACTLLGWQKIDVYLLPEGLTDDEYLLIELQENSARNDLTRGQRKAYAGEIGHILQKLTTNPNGQILEFSWWEKLWKTTGVTEQTLRNWWNAFCAQTDRALTPRQALETDRTAFFAWLEVQQQREADDKARRVAEAAAQRRAEDMADAVANLQQLATDYGRQAVLDEVIHVFVADDEED